MVADRLNYQCGCTFCRSLNLIMMIKQWGQWKCHSMKPYRLQIETRRLYRSISTSVFPQISFKRLAILLRLKNYFTKWLLLHRFKWILSTIFNYLWTNSLGIYYIFTKFVSFLVGVNVLFFHVFYRWLFIFYFFIFTLFQYSFLILIIENVIYIYHIVPRRGTLKRFKNGG